MSYFFASSFSSYKTLSYKRRNKKVNNIHENRYFSQYFFAHFTKHTIVTGFQFYKEMFVFFSVSVTSCGVCPCDERFAVLQCVSGIKINQLNFLKILETNCNLKIRIEWLDLSMRKHLVDLSKIHSEAIFLVRLWKSLIPFGHEC